jgi:hypothetical protein
MSNKWIFIGPTLYDSHLSNADLTDRAYIIMPPAKRGDIELLTTQNPVGEIVLVDGTFHHFPAVSHSEIRNGLKMGWKIFGMSSMGAIRAAEMSHMGMIGYGEVYHRFKNHQLDDDEVALLFAPQSFSFKPLSEPMIHFRVALDVAVNENLMSEFEKMTISQIMKNRWYGWRTINEFNKAVRENTQMSDTQLDNWLDRFVEFRIKSLDLDKFILNLKP